MELGIDTRVCKCNGGDRQRRNLDHAYGFPALLVMREDTVRDEPSLDVIKGLAQRQHGILRRGLSDFLQ